MAKRVERSEKTKFLDPEVLQTIAGMELRARLVVEGFISGLHKSPYQGFSVEFAEHRQYTPGDELRHIDWRVFGKSDRFYIKLYEEDTNLKCYLLLDASGSMGYHSNKVSKLWYGANLAAALTQLMLQQLDSVGLLLFDEEIRRYIPPRSNPRHRKIIFGELEELKPGKRTQVSRIFHDFAERIRRRGLIIVISDLFDDPDAVLTSLQHFRHKKHEVIVFHVLDPYELTFPFERLTLFRDLEGAIAPIMTEPHVLKRRYLEKLEEFRGKLKRGCRESAIDYFEIDTSENFGHALTRYLATRHRRRP
jgi:uncharacterized protein (DUF58 family)